VTGTADSAELPVVAALRALSVFSADQAGAYREHFAAFAAALGEDVETKLGRFLRGWAREGAPGTVVLTGNAGTGKTAAAEAYCRALGVPLPDRDVLLEVSPGRRVLKDLSGLPDPAARADAVRDALASLSAAQTLVCANEGVLRDAFADLEAAGATAALEAALRRGATREGDLMVVNVNRQRPTSERLWNQLLDYVARGELWTGCADCPFDVGGCPMRSNAEQLRRPVVREQLRTLFRLGTGEAVPTLREVLAILSWAVVGTESCSHVKERYRDLGLAAFTASDGYFTRILGGGMSPDAAERSPLLAGVRRSGLGDVSDLQVDGWLRDTNGAPDEVRGIAGEPDPAMPATDGRRPGLAGTRSPLDRVKTKQHEMTFHALGEMVSTDEDPTRVEDGLDALVQGDGVANAPAQTLWRQRVYFEAVNDLGGPAAAARRLLYYRHITDLTELAGKAARGADTVIELNELVRGLNFLVTGFSSPSEGLIVPDPACLFARDPGSFRPARPSLVHSQVDIERLALWVPDQGLVRDLLDVDHVDVDLVVDGSSELALRIRPRMYEAIREAAEFRGPVGQGVAEMNDLRGFYGRLAAGLATEDSLRVADPDSNPPRTGQDHTSLLRWDGETLMAAKKKRQRLTPGAIAEELFCLDPDRDERAPQLCAETLLTLVQNGYRAPEGGTLTTPKRQRFAVRSLALGENFLGGRDDGRAGDDETTPAEYGASLAAGREVRGSAHLSLAHQTLQGLVDPDTQRASQPGAWLLRPFHESLLWYDARKPSPNSPQYSVRKVYMRGSGITLARMLADPADATAAALGRSAVDAIRSALTAQSPLADISTRLESVLPADAAYTRPPVLEDDEAAAWQRGADPRLAQLAGQLCRHAEGVMRQAGASPPSRLWQLRSILAVDLALHVVRTAWVATGAPATEQYLLLSFGGGPRAQNPVRQRSEDSYRRARNPTQRSNGPDPRASDERTRRKRPRRGLAFGIPDRKRTRQH